MIERNLQHVVQQRLRQYPAVALLGPRQVGKTTLAKTIAAQHPGAMLLDLERESDRAAIERPELFFAAHRDRNSPTNTRRPRTADRGCVDQTSTR